MKFVRTTMIALAAPALLAAGMTSATAAHPAPAQNTAPVKSSADTVTVTVASSTANGVGSKLVCNPGTWAPAATSYVYKWTRDSSEITGASTSTGKYTTTAADQGHTIGCTAAGFNKYGGAGASVSAPASNYVVPAAPTTPPPSSTGPSAPWNQTKPVVFNGATGTGTQAASPHAKTGTISCSYGTWGGNQPTSFSVGWTRNGAAILKADGTPYVGQSYALNAATDSGTKIDCRVTATYTDSTGSASSGATESNQITIK